MVRRLRAAVVGGNSAATIMQREGVNDHKSNQPVPAVGQLAHQKQQQEQGGLHGQIQGELSVPEEGGQRELPEELRGKDQAQAEETPHGRPR